MRCPKCNDVLPIGGKVCKKCNFNIYTNQYEVSPPQPVPVKPVQPPVPPQPVSQQKPTNQKTANQKPKQKSKALTWIITVLVALLATGVGRYVGGLVGRSVAENWQKDSGNGYAYQEEVDATVNPAFDTFLLNRGLTYTPVITAMDSECFAVELEDGMVEILEFGYTGDVVKEQVDTVYYPISDLSEEDISIVEANVRDIFGAMTDSGLAEVRYDRIGEQYLVAQLRFTSLDTKNAIQAMTDAGLLQKDAATGKYVDYISMDKTAAALLENGFVQR